MTTSKSPTSFSVQAKDFKGTQVNKSASASKPVNVHTPPGAGAIARGIAGKTLPNGKTASVSGGVNASAINKSGSFGNQNSVVRGQGNVQVGQVSANGSAHAGFDPKSLSASAGVEGHAGANLVNASGSVDTKFGTHAEGNATVGANVNGQAGVTVDPTHGNVSAGAHADAFAGAQAGGSVSQHIGPADVGATGHVRAGIGANFDADVGMKDGKIQAKVDIGATLGIGGDIGFNVSVDPGAAIKDVGHFFGL